MNKPWTRHERSHIQDRALRQESEYVLPLRLDDSEVPGLSGVVGHIDYHSRTPEEIADLIVQKLGKEPPSDVRPSASPDPDIPLPRVRREFTDRDREEFSRDLYTYIRSYFQKALPHIGDADPEVETDLRDITDSKFIAALYLRGDLRQQTKIWRGAWAPGSGTDQIRFALGTSVDPDTDNSMNGWIHIENDGFELRAKLDNFSFADFNHPREITDRNAIAELIWRRFSSFLEH